MRGTGITISDDERLYYGSNISQAPIKANKGSFFIITDNGLESGNIIDTYIFTKVWEKIGGVELSEIPDASETQRGLVNTDPQTFSGNKTVKGGATGNPFEVKDNNNVSKLLVTTNGIDIGKNQFNESHIGTNSANTVFIKPANYSFYFTSSGKLYGTMPVLNIGAVTDSDVISLYPNTNATFGRTLKVNNKLLVVGQAGVGIDIVDASAKLQVDSTTQGFLPPRMTQAQREAIVLPATGLVVYQTDGTAPTAPGLYVKNDTGWARLING